MEHTLVIDSDGSARFVYDDSLRFVFECGIPRIRRASHVEPCAGSFWSVDLSPFGGGILGPFVHRRDALEAEAAWINSRL